MTGSASPAGCAATGGEAVADVAAFDVDGTLTVRDCVAPFLARVAGWRGLAVAAASRPRQLLTGVARRDRDRLKSAMVGGVLRGRSVDAVERLGEEFAVHVHERWLREDTVARLRWHQRTGHRVVLVSASLGPYLRPLGRRLGVDGVLCAEPIRHGDHYGDGLDGQNCRSAEKVRRLDAWLAEHGLNAATLWAYGDSSGDRELLDRADHSEMVRRRRVPAVPIGRTSC